MEIKLELDRLGNVQLTPLVPPGPGQAYDLRGCKEPGIHAVLVWADSAVPGTALRWMRYKSGAPMQVRILAGLPDAPTVMRLDKPNPQYKPITAETGPLPDGALNAYEPTNKKPKVRADSGKPMGPPNCMVPIMLIKQPVVIDAAQYAVVSERNGPSYSQRFDKAKEEEQKRVLRMAQEVPRCYSGGEVSFLWKKTNPDPDKGQQHLWQLHWNCTCGGIR